jgi:hypothetical protein
MERPGAISAAKWSSLATWSSAACRRRRHTKLDGDAQRGRMGRGDSIENGKRRATTT